MYTINVPKSLKEPMKDFLAQCIEQQKALASDIELKFCAYFETAPVPGIALDGAVNELEGVVSVEIARPGSSSEDVAAQIAKLPRGRGLYVIMTNRTVPGSEGCSFTIPGSNLKAVYRGHSSNIRERVMGHLINRAYLEMCSSKTNKKPWNAFFKIEDGSGIGGLDVTAAPFSAFVWAVVAFNMKDSTEPLRMLAENGFSKAFGTPPRSAKEPTVARPRKVA